MNRHRFIRIPLACAWSPNYFIIPGIYSYDVEALELPAVDGSRDGYERCRYPHKTFRVDD